jgi:hypothetical protein
MTLVSNNVLDISVRGRWVRSEVTKEGDFFVITYAGRRDGKINDV